MSRLAPDWVTWLAKNLLEDEDPENLIGVLMEQGLCRPDATAELTELTESPLFQALKDAARPRALTQRLRIEHLRLGPREIPRRSGLTPEEVMAQHIAAQVPVILTDLTTDWPASQWTWESLASDHGGLRVEACRGRSTTDSPDQNWRELVGELSFEELIEQITTPGIGNDLYVVANNQVLEGPISALRADLRGVKGLIPEERLSETGAWIGGAGTVTPLHHDTSDILFCPFLGSKRVWLVPPEEIELTAQAEKFWAPKIDLDRTDLAIREGVVGPGEVLLIPSGWWHQVEGLEPSVTVTFAGLGHRNCFRWFVPGFPQVP